MTLRALQIGQLVHVRGYVAVARSHSAIVRIPTCKLDVEWPIEVSFADLVLPVDTDGLCEAAGLLMQRLEALRELGLRVQAEAYEVGGHVARRSQPA